MPPSQLTLFLNSFAVRGRNSIDPMSGGEETMLGEGVREGGSETEEMRI